MKSLVLILTLLSATTGALAQDQFTDHASFYQHVEQAHGLSRPFVARTVGPATPVDHEVRVQDTSREWGAVRLRRDRIVINGKPWRWLGATRPLNKATPIAIDLEIVRVREQRTGERLCIQSPAGSSASSARWQHVIVVARAGKPPIKLKLLAWTSPYGSCDSLFVDQQGHLLAGLFELQMESESSVQAAAFSLRSLDTGKEVARYVLTLADPGNAFVFSAAPVAARTSP
jgi:hypothetical protein